MLKALDRKHPQEGHLSFEPNICLELHWGQSQSGYHTFCIFKKNMQSVAASVDDSDFDCIVCFDAFCSGDADTHVPMMLVDCGHNVCSSCLVALPKKACPMCRTPIIFKAMPNRLLVTLLEKRNKMKKDLEFFQGRLWNVEIENEQLEALLLKSQRQHDDLKTALRSVAHKKAELEIENNKLKKDLGDRLERDERISAIESKLFNIGRKALEEEHHEIKVYPGCGAVRNGNMTTIGMTINYVMY
ncbi:MAG: hypothetical protein K2Q45_06820 [Nitrosomonas sp.]|nr:hypothetical protein [Nitrosomonas sp.]